MNTCYNPFTLEGKTILVTGASSGIGRATAIECSRMGATVIAAARNVERLEETLAKMNGEGHLIISADLTTQEGIDAIVSSVPKLDGLVLCAGIGNTTLQTYATREKIQKIYEINFFSQVELFRLLIKKRILKNGSSVVALSSIGGVYRYTIANGIYGSAKSALTSWMKFAAKEYGSKHIRVNCICPAMIETPLIHGLTITEEQLNEDKKRYPLGRYGKPEEVAYGAIYLLSEASSWTTGSCLIIDGGIL